MGDRRSTPWYERAFWSVHARSYDDFGGPDSPEVAVVTRLIEDMSGQRRFDVLDVGAGTGNYAIPLAAAGHRVAAVDVAPGMLARLREKADERGVSIDTLRTDVHGGVDARPDSFDLVLCSYVLQVIREPAALVAEIGRVLRPDGYVVVVAADPTVSTKPVVPNDAPWPNRFVWRVKRTVASRSPQLNPSRAELVELLASQGFEVIRERPDHRRLILVGARAEEGLDPQKR